MTWQLKAACRDADPARFDVAGWTNDRVLAEFREVAALFCDACPVAQDCAAFADVNRHEGLYGGTYRRVHQGRYVWDVLLPGTPEPQLTPRRPSVPSGWFA